MTADRQPDPPMTRNSARKNGQKKGAASPALSASIPATTAAVPACGGADGVRPTEGHPAVASFCQTNSTTAASFFSPVSQSPPSPTIVTPSLTTTAAAPPLEPLPDVVVIKQIPPPLPYLSRIRRRMWLRRGHWLLPRRQLWWHRRELRGVDGEVGSFQQILKVVSGSRGHQQQEHSSPLLSPAAALVSSFLASPVGMGSGRGINFPAASTSENLDEVGSDVGKEPIPSEEKQPNIFLRKVPTSCDVKVKLKYYPPVVTELGTRRAIIPDELIQKQANEWTLTLAGYFLGKRLAFPFVQYHVRRMWKKYGLTDVILNDQGYFFFKFNSDQGLNFVFENGPWLFNSMPIFIQKWQPGLSFDKPEPKIVPLWVNIYGLPLDVWDYEIISRIASVGGEPVSVDRYTDEMCETKSVRANFARVLVNVSADYELPSDIDAIILGKLKKFKTEFLRKPKRCSHCKVFGHDFDMCVVRPRTVDEVEKNKPLSCDVGESSKPKDDGFKFPKRKKKPKQIVAPLKVGPKVAFNTGIKINQRYVPETNLPTTDLLDKGKVSNQFTVLEEDPQWILDKKEVDDFIEKRCVGLEPVIINSWSRTKLDYFIGRWEIVFGKELDGTLRGFTLSDQQIISDDDGTDSEFENDVEYLEDEHLGATLETPFDTWLQQKQDIDRRIDERDWPTVTQMTT
ncbi:hypothetical protein OSB04_018865 [Centaurea solstitialis]|uniref:DUF4283 domain-containing protein n=1 Tax=Centaurea solstitialis TaxID=347529 RepID=A0AA38W2A9_9ASTR|nr:hypothetical protein OSB04_018865 [Centaurea solstitialis]